MRSHNQMRTSRVPIVNHIKKEKWESMRTIFSNLGIRLQCKADLYTGMGHRLPCFLLLQYLLAAFVKFKVIQYGSSSHIILKNVEHFNTLGKTHLKKETQKTQTLVKHTEETTKTFSVDFCFYQKMQTSCVSLLLVTGL